MGQQQCKAATKPAENGAPLAPAEVPRSVSIASSGIRDDQDAAEFLSAVIGDVMTQSVSVRIANTSVNALGKLLKLVDMRHRYGDPEKARSLQLVKCKADDVVSETLCASGAEVERLAKPVSP